MFLFQYRTFASVIYPYPIMKFNLKEYIPKNIQFIFLSLVLLLAVNIFFRATLFLQHNELAVTATRADISYCFFHVGLLFDLYISLIIVLLPYLLSSIPFLRNKDSKPLYVVSNVIIIVLAWVNIAVSSIDLGFFDYYNSRVSNTIFDWTNDIGLMLKVMSNDSTYLPELLTFLLAASLYTFLQIQIFKKTVSRTSKKFSLAYRWSLFFGFLILIFFGIRGSFNFHQRPLNIDDAFFSDNLFLNQLGTNAVYSLANSYRYVDIDYFTDDEKAVEAALTYLNRARSKSPDPFKIHIYGSDSIRPNIILIFMESMSNAMVSRYHPEYITTPFLDSLAKNGIIFDNFFSAGIHTHNAIFTTLYGLPAVMHNKPMSSLATARQKFYGLPWILKEKDYRTLFYVTGSKKFDNMNDFLLYNGFDKVIGEDDYPFDSLTTKWGVTDKTMFNRILADCDSLDKRHNRFFVNALTISAHEGCYVPDEYRSKLVNNIFPYDLYEYSDLVLKEFMTLAKTRSWFDHTVFVFVGDHGQNFATTYDMNLNYHRVPLIIFAPAIFSHTTYEGPGLQQDIYPTLFGLLDFSYINVALGVDLFKQKRKYAYFSADSKLGILDKDYFLIYRGKNNISIYKYKNKSVKDLYPENRIEADSMLRYGFSMLQSTRYLINHKLTTVDSVLKSAD